MTTGAGPAPVWSFSKQTEIWNFEISKESEIREATKDLGTELRETSLIITWWAENNER